MKVFVCSALLLLLSSPVPADQVILVYTPGNTLFTQGASKTITSSTMCADPAVKRLLDKYDMTIGHQMASDLVDLLNGYYLFSVEQGKGSEIADSLSAITNVKIATINGSVHPLSESRREPLDYWYNHTYKWEEGHHHYGCDDPAYMPIPHYRQWHLTRGQYDRAWKVTVATPLMSSPSLTAVSKSIIRT